MQYNTLEEKPKNRLREDDYTSSHARAHTQRSRLRSLHKNLVITATCVLGFVGIQYLIPTASSINENGSVGMRPQTSLEEINPSVFSWHQITPTPELVYHSCFGDYECARLEVPMNWNRTDGKGSKVAIAIARLPAKVSVTDPRYGGPILINPGGPGGSGVAQLMLVGTAMQAIVDSEHLPNVTELDYLHKYHDIIGFDPRGISQTTPGIACFPDSLSREAWNMQNEALGLLGSSEDSFMRNWYRSKALAEGCSTATGSTLDGSEAIGEFVNTSPVARDMLEIVERHAEWVEKKGKLAQTTHDMAVGYDPSQEIVRRTRWAKGEEKLKYWGNSYGTIIGQTFASMFPDRVERLVLDGVCDSHDYYYGSWFSNLQDSDKILDKFFEYCAEGGPEECSFYTPGGASAIKQEFDDLLQDVFAHPRAVPSSLTRGPDVITWSDVKSMVRLGMYQPLIYLPMVSDLLVDIAKGNGSLFADFKNMDRDHSCPSAECKIAGPYSQECNAAGDNGADATLAILCTDGEGLGQVDEIGFQQYWHALQNQSRVLGDWWAHTRLGCVGWKTRARSRFGGPFSGNTSHGILLIGNTLDPVTPLNNAQRMAANFPGSVVLQQDSEGHTSWSSPSVCTAKVAKAYFQTGVLPEPDSICEPAQRPFQAKVTEMSESDGVLTEALKVVQENYMNLKFGSRSFAF